ncbi:DinB family protein [Planctomicrobium sp. SH664]|uniref:DinB family protein n=1 Tax=Planctomicrobium sp. SH664 TaxID=3448125 RepID=UPI003F5B861B
MSLSNLIDQYLAGPAQLRTAVQGITADQMAAAPVPGRWSTQQLICHLSDFELVNADRMKRILAEEQPLFFSGDPDLFAASLAYDLRNVEEELVLIEVVRSHMGRILKSLPPAAFERVGRHSEEGLLTLRDLVERITRHIPHHLPYIQEKRQALGI